MTEIGQNAEEIKANLPRVSDIIEEFNKMLDNNLF